MLSRAATPAESVGRCVPPRPGAHHCLPPSLTPIVSPPRLFPPLPTPATARPRRSPLLQKCDEQPNEDGACQTCVRLRLQCLGFGAKRPDWMRVCFVSRILRGTGINWLLSFAGEQQRHRAPREDQGLPCFTRHDQGPLWLWPSHDGGRSPSPCLGRPPPHVSLEPSYPYPLGGLLQRRSPTASRQLHLLRAHPPLRCHASGAAAVRPQYVPSYICVRAG